MYCKPKKLISFLVLLTITHLLNCGSLSAKEDAAGNGIFYFYNLTDETGTSRRIRSGGLKLNAINANSKRIEHTRIKRVSDGHHNETFTDPLHTSELLSSWRPDNGLVTHSHNESASLRSFTKRASDMDAGFQADTPAYKVRGVPGKAYYSSPLEFNSHAFKPMVRCFGNVMTLTAHGRAYSHILVDRAGVSPLYLFQLPSYCGYNVQVTWRDLVVMAPFDACYITQENGSYVLSLLWWGRPIKMACPATHVSQPSVFCSRYGMVIRIERAQEPVEKHRVKVNGKVLPVLSETCAYHVNSSDVVILYTAYSSKCVTLKARKVDGEYQLVIIVDGKQFALSCPFPRHLSPFHPYNHSHLFQRPLKRKPLIPHVPGSIRVIGTIRQPKTPSKPPAVPSEPPLVTQFYPDPLNCPPYPEAFCSQVPHHDYQYNQTLSADSESTVQPMPGMDISNQPTYMPPTTPVMQTDLLPTIPISPPVPTEQPSKLMSPSLICTRNRITATLPSAKMASIKVKETKTDSWVSIASVPASCDYTLRSRGGAVVLSSPLPACHTEKLSSSVTAFFIRFWDSSRMRTRTIQLQCRHTLPPDAIEPFHQMIPHTSSAPSRQPPDLQVLCSSQHMSVNVPPGPIFRLVVEKCNVVADQQLVCGSGALSSTECHDKGCCYSLDTQLCYYPMDALAHPTKLPLTSPCSRYRWMNAASTDMLLVECRYYPGSVVSVGYLVKSPSLGPAIKAQGVFGVQLRIAKDEYYEDFYPQYHQPLRMLLGKPLYLEVRLINPPDPTAMLLVHYCVAYPRSARSAWILIYDGCPNSLDLTPTHTPPATPAEALTNHVRRFTVTTFKFLPDDDSLQTDEEIYFMCSTEVCLPSDGPCIEGCFEDPANVKS
ncbi:hypothetical protein E1301_Tti020526 [Triplophysa tibetana]|uniref:Zona pellucida sperm-binding protein 4 n=1 Tax=Triplophysa tibetana TaxID=1572043 RepID=A0A5A9PHP1_9TELE|nr:hypothetical protein E1301_Tti020526 [Triplophysa tibetana]